MTPPSQSAFPNPDRAPANGLVACGARITPRLLVDAYSHGIFPWFDDDAEPVLWWSPDPRAVMAPRDMRISRSLARKIRSGAFHVSVDLAFDQVTAACAAPRASSEGTWITPRMRAGYRELHNLGLAHSVETWCDDHLVGGLYGVSLGRIFFGESMFSRVTDASKVALARLARQLDAWRFTLIDCQLPSRHLASLGARTMPRSEFLALVTANRDYPDQQGLWAFDA